MNINVLYPNNSYSASGEAIVTQHNRLAKITLGGKRVHIYPQTSTEARKLAYTLLLVAEQLQEKEK